MIEKTADFLLNVPPIDEISDDLCGVVEKFRYRLLTKKEAMKILLKEHKEKIVKLHEENESINTEIVKV